MTLFRKRVDLNGLALQSIPIFARTQKGEGRKFQSITVGFVNQPGVNTDLSVVAWPKVVITLQTLDPDVYGVLTIGDVGYIASVEIVPPIMVTHSGGSQSGYFPNVVNNNFKDIKTVDATFLAIENYFGPVELSLMIEYKQAALNPTEIVQVILGVDR